MSLDEMLAQAYGRMLAELGSEFGRCLRGKPTIGRQGRPPVRSDAAAGRVSEDIAPAQAGAQDGKPA